MMETSELIKTLRWCGSEDERHEMCVDESYRCPMWNEDRITDDCKAELMTMAVDALEEADEKIADCVAAIDALDDSNDAYIKENERLKKRIAELEDDLRNGTISNPERFKIYDYTVKDLILFAEMCKRNDVQESDLKQAAWNLEFAVRAVMNERQEIVKNTMEEITMRFTPDFEKAFTEMKGERK